MTKHDVGFGGDVDHLTLEDDQLVGLCIRSKLDRR